MKMLLAGRWLDHQDKFPVYRKFNRQHIDDVPQVTEADVISAVEKAVNGAAIAARMPVHQRIKILSNVAAFLEKDQESFARLIATEGIKTIREARREVLRAINTFVISAEEARRIGGETLPFDSFPGAENRLGYYYRFPIGIISAIISFNDPLNLAAHKLGPAIAAGNAVILKPSELTPLTSLNLGKLFLEAGLPPEILSILPGEPTQMGDLMISDPRIRMISFTGGSKTGQKITQMSGLKKIQMEMGSNSPVIVMNDADVSKAADACVSGSFAAAGQNCIGVQRIYIQADIMKEFQATVVNKTKNLVTGDNLDEATDVGPIISEKEIERIDAMVKDAINTGGDVLTGGKRMGNCYLPTVLTGVSDQASISHEEVFGPVVALYEVETLRQAIDKSNAVPFGLNAAIFTQNLADAYQAIQELQTGTVIVNDSTDYRLDMMPFGGVKHSGLGREGIRHAIHEMTEIKVVCFNL